MDIAQEMLTMFNDDPDLLNIVAIGDESWADYVWKQNPIMDAFLLRLRR